MDYRTEPSPEESPSDALARAVATVEGVPVEALEPLYDLVDPDALDAVLQSSGGTVRLVYEGYRIEATAHEIRLSRDRRGEE